ncbi:MAG: coproporphyrinogen dehydrogenase HemZ [Clostridia bacterium]|nr:coproporphyrinogen dehydrogenase HemZ [Clostridia bacterium]
MKLSIVTHAPELANDLADIARVFFGQLDYKVYPEKPGPDGQADITLIMEESRLEGKTAVNVKAAGIVSGEACREYETVPEFLEQKRIRKRAAKLAAYEVFRLSTGRQPPWGSLTGIRPTRLIYQQMEQGRSFEEALSVMKTTFGVTEPKIRLLQDIVTVQNELPAPSQDQVELYIGIPFCVTRCTYCSFSSGEIGNGKLVRPYVDALLREIELTWKLIAEHGLKVSTVYMGGGTPTSLPANEIARVLEAVEPLADGHEFTVEAGRPDTIDGEKLNLFKNAHVTRISINPQTFHDVTLQRIGRRHTSEQTVSAYELARSLGFDDINMDLIAGLPGEDIGMFRESLEWIRRLKPDSMTVHSLAIKHASAMHLYGAPLPDGQMTAEMLEEAGHCAGDMDFRPYYMYRQKYMAGALENVAYARRGAECLYNVRMMEETGHVLALGAGAISKRVAPSGGKIVRAPNVGNIEEYIRRVDEMFERKSALWSAELPAVGNTDCQPDEKVL